VRKTFWFLKLATVIGVGYLSWVYILPQVFQMLGRWTIASTGIFLIFLVVAAPAILGTYISEALHASAIKFDPFGQLEVTRQKNACESINIPYC
jgi:hypothetical protein